MLTPEQIVTEWLSVYDPETRTGRSPLALVYAIRTYGDQRAAEERERCVQAAIGQANALNTEALALDDGFYAGYKLAIRNVIAAIRASAPAE